MTEKIEVCIFLIFLVGPPGFEPGTSCTPSKRASQAAPRPDLTGKCSERPQSTTIVRGAVTSWIRLSEQRFAQKPSEPYTDSYADGDRLGINDRHKPSDFSVNLDEADRPGDETTSAPAAFAVSFPSISAGAAAKSAAHTGYGNHRRAIHRDGLAIDRFRTGLIHHGAQYWLEFHTSASPAAVNDVKASQATSVNFGTIRGPQTGRIVRKASTHSRFSWSEPVETRKHWGKPKAASGRTMMPCASRCSKACRASCSEGRTAIAKFASDGTTVIPASFRPSVKYRSPRAFNSSDRCKNSLSASAAMPAAWAGVEGSNGSLTLSRFRISSSCAKP